MRKSSSVNFFCQLYTTFREFFYLFKALILSFILKVLIDMLSDGLIQFWENSKSALKLLMKAMYVW